jgi:hypothetical protein
MGDELTGPEPRRPPISLYTEVLRTEGHAYDVGVWDCPSFKDYSCRAVPNPNVTIRFCIAVCV